MENKENNYQTKRDLQILAKKEQLEERGLGGFITRKVGQKQEDKWYKSNN